MERVDYDSVIISDLLGYHGRNELNINPWYQRRSVWTRPQKAYLINTLHENKPVPTIYIRHSIDLETEKSIKEVVDGQQRIRCIIDYKNDQFPARHPAHHNAIKYSELRGFERGHFLQSALSVGYLIGATDSDVIEIFARINSVSKTLNPQERRNAKYSGAFKQFCVSEATTRLPFWRNNGIFRDSQISRMLEVQFISDLVINLDRGLQDFSSRALNACYKAHDDAFDKSEEIKKRLDNIFKSLLRMPDGLIKRSVFSNPQLLFSLMLVIDREWPTRTDELVECITDLDSRVEAVRTRESPQAMSTEMYASFTSGNLHRIRARRNRDQVITSFLSR